MTPEQEQQLFTNVQSLSDNVQSINTRLDKLTDDVEKLTETVKDSNLKFGYYQQATQQVVNLAFGLIASATVIVIVSSVLGK